MLVHRELTGQIIGLAIEVHQTIGPGLLESVYCECLVDELLEAAIPCQREVAVPVVYKDKMLPLGFRADIIVAGCILIEIKALSAILPVHETQLLTYLRLSQIRVGLLMNFHASRLKDGLRRLIV